MYGYVHATHAIEIYTHSHTKLTDTLVLDKKIILSFEVSLIISITPNAHQAFFSKKDSLHTNGITLLSLTVCSTYLYFVRL